LNAKVERTPEQIARTEALFRNVNEEIRDASGRFNAEVGEFVCECGDPTCTEHVEVPLVEYEDVRSDPTRFVVRPGHVMGPVERVVARNHRYTVIEKVDRVVSAIVKRLNPRPETT
jgi:hypothetical protein